MTKIKLARYIDHTLLKPTATFDDINRLCDEAEEYGFYSVCVNSSFVKYAARRLSQSPIKIATTVGFPLGAMSTTAKAFEASEAVRDGASEIDMVMNIGYLKSGEFFAVKTDIEKVVEAVKSINSDVTVKVILEMGYLKPDEKVSACQLAKDGGADFIKTSTGFGAGGATIEDVSLMRKLAGDVIKVKASGGIRDYKTAVSMIEAGAARIGTSSGIDILKGAEE